MAVLMQSTVRPFELSIYGEVFGTDRTASGLPAFGYAVVAERPGIPVPVAGGLTVTPAAGLDRLAEADLIAIAPAEKPSREISPAVAAALRAAVDRGARIAAVCSGAFTLAAAGLLDGRRAATHWRYAADLAAWFPRVSVDADVLYVDDDPIFTSAGTAAGIDLCLHLIAKDFGAAAAATVARGMVTGPHRPGGHAQYLRSPVAAPRHDDGIAELLGWALGNLHEDLSVDLLARRVRQSRRSFARRFRAATGTSPYAWVLEQRLQLAQRLLETAPAMAVEETAARAGFSSSASLRQHFQRRFGCSPTRYRSRFAPPSRG